MNPHKLRVTYRDKLSGIVWTFDIHSPSLACLSLRMSGAPGRLAVFPWAQEGEVVNRWLALVVVVYSPGDVRTTRLKTKRTVWDCTTGWSIGTTRSSNT